MTGVELHLDAVRAALRRPPARVDLDAPRRAAVAGVLLPNLDLLLMRRAEHPGDPWSGHLSFPGGREEPEDPSPLHTAMRETQEELGLVLQPAWALGELDELTTVGVQPPTIIRPYLFAIPALPALAPNPREVAGVHRIGLRALLEGEGRGTMILERHGRRMSLPRVDFDGVRLWGLTLHMIDDLLHRLDGRGRGLAR